jgi:hypothetical protein
MNDGVSMAYQFFAPVNRRENREGTLCPFQSHEADIKATNEKCSKQDDH